MMIPTREFPKGRALRHWTPWLAGVATLGFGLCGMAEILAVAYGSSAENSAWGFRLGLAGAVLVSAMAQVLILLGSRQVIRSLRPDGGLRFQRPSPERSSA